MIPYPRAFRNPLVVALLVLACAALFLAPLPATTDGPPQDAKFPPELVKFVPFRKEPADIVLTGGQVVNVFTLRIEPANVAIVDGRIAGVGPYSWPARETIDLGGRNLGIVFSTMNMAGNLGSFAFTWAAPRLVQSGGWDACLFVFAGAHIAAALCWLFINPEGVIGEPRGPEYRRTQKL